MSKIIKESAIIPIGNKSKFIRFIKDIAAKNSDITLSYISSEVSDNKTKIDYSFICKTIEQVNDTLKKVRAAENIYNNLPPVDLFGENCAKWY